MEAPRQDRTSSVGLLILRLGVGGFMLTHGLGKLKMLLAGDFESFGDPIGLGSGLSLVLVTLAEFAGALFVMLGLGTRLAAFSVVVAMAVAAFVAHREDPLTMERAFKLFMAGETKFPLSKEPALLYLIPFLALVFTGAGRLSFDAVIRRRWHGESEKPRPAP
jgi:putative oxidoreductase